MRKLSSLLMIALIALVGIGCDSGNDDPSAAERFVGTWALTGATDATGNRIADFGAVFQSVVLVNAAAGTFTITATPLQGEAVQVAGNYLVDEGTKKITLSASLGGTTIPLAFTYAFQSDTVATLTADATSTVLLNTLFGTTLQAPAVLTVTKQ